MRGKRRWKGRKGERKEMQGGRERSRGEKHTLTLSTNTLSEELAHAKERE